MTWLWCVLIAVVLVQAFVVRDLREHLRLLEHRLRVLENRAMNEGRFGPP